MATHWSRRYRAQVLGERLIIERRDGKPVRCGWDTLQRIKNEMLGEHVQAVEVFPAATDVVNEINRRHLWIVEGRIGFQAR